MPLPDSKGKGETGFTSIAVHDYNRDPWADIYLTAFIGSDKGFRTLKQHIMFGLKNLFSIMPIYDGQTIAILLHCLFFYFQEEEAVIVCKRQSIPYWVKLLASNTDEIRNGKRHWG